MKWNSSTVVQDGIHTKNKQYGDAEKTQIVKPKCKQVHCSVAVVGCVGDVIAGRIYRVYPVCT